MLFNLVFANMDLNHLHLSQLWALPSRQNMLHVKGLNMVLIVMLMCSEIGKIIMPLGTERWRNEGEEQWSEAGGIRSGYFNECTWNKQRDIRFVHDMFAISPYDNNDSSSLGAFTLRLVNPILSGRSDLGCHVGSNPSCRRVLSAPASH